MCKWLGTFGKPAVQKAMANGWRSRYHHLMDEGRERALLIAACILAARRLASPEWPRFPKINNMSKHKVVIGRIRAGGGLNDEFAVKVDGVPMMVKSVGVWPHGKQQPTRKFTFSNRYFKRSKDYRQIRLQIIEELNKRQGT